MSSDERQDGAGGRVPDGWQGPILYRPEVVLDDPRRRATDEPDVQVVEHGPDGEARIVHSPPKPRKRSGG